MRWHRNAQVRNNHELDRWIEQARIDLKMTPRRVSVKIPARQDDSASEPLLDSQSSAGSDSKSDDEAQTSNIVPRDHDARQAVVAGAIESATTSDVRRRLRGATPLVVVVDVPTAAWVKPVEDYFCNVLSGRWATFARDGGNRGRDKTSVGNDEAAKKISAGRKVVGIAANPTGILPATLLAAADITIKIVPATGAMVRRALKLCLRSRAPGHIDDKIVAGLDFDDLVAAMRAGSTPAQAVERMRAISNLRSGNTQADKYPVLENAVEFGEVQKWGLELARDIETFRCAESTLNLSLWSETVSGGAIFFGEYGCGKTIAADSIAAACRIPIIKVSIADYFTGDSHLGVVLQEQRATYFKAKALAERNVACIWFIDELDALPSRLSFSSNTISDRGSSRNADWWLPIINDFLLICDQAKNDRVILCGATNRIRSVDPALLRPGRFERAIEITRPNKDGIINILRFHLRADLQGDDLTEAARLAEGSTAAELMDRVRSARRRARNAQRPLTLDDLQFQVQGEDVRPAVLRRVSVHEAAHAVTTVVLRIGELRYVTIQSRGLSGGHTKVSSNDEDLMTLASVEDRVVSILSAGVAEKCLLNSKSIGSGGTDTSDDGVASSMLAVIHASTSLTGKYFHRCSSEEALATVRADPELRLDVELHLRRLEKRATDLVERYRESIDAVAKALAKRRHLTGDEVVGIMQAVNDLKFISPEGA
jgi:cell division protease FtsH